MLVSTERVNKSSDRIQESRKVMLETEDLGVALLQDLHQQRQSLSHANNTVLLCQHFVLLRISSQFFGVSHLSPCLGKIFLDYRWLNFIFTIDFIKLTTLSTFQPCILWDPSAYNLKKLYQTGAKEVVA